MRARLEGQGFPVVARPEDADFIVLNTCAFIEAAVEESLDTFFELAALKRVQNGEASLLVAGCLPSRFGEELARELPEARAFVPVAEEAAVAEVLMSLLEQDAGEGRGGPDPPSPRRRGGSPPMGFGGRAPPPRSQARPSAPTDRCFNDLTPAAKPPLTSLSPVS
jgi:ribosomal protein S12 methylthiotransferase